MVGGAQAKKRRVGGPPWRSRERSSASSSAMFAAPSSGSVTSSRKLVTLVTARRAFRSISLSPTGRGSAVRDETLPTSRRPQFELKGEDLRRGLSQSAAKRELKQSGAGSRHFAGGVPLSRGWRAAPV